MGDLNLYGRHAHDFELTFGLSDMTLGNQDLNREENLENMDWLLEDHCMFNSKRDNMKFLEL